jgi:hypothetical protein
MILLPRFPASAFTVPVSNPSPKPENFFLNLICNVALPTLVLTKFSTDKWLGPVWGLVIALAFPVGYGIYDFATRKKTNTLSILGFVSVLLSGGMGLFKADGFWFAVKDAVLPTCIGAFVLFSMRTKTPLLKEMIFNDQVVDVPRVEAALAERGNGLAFEALMRRSSIWLAVSFIASAPVNFALARYILRSPPGTPEFNAELGRMHIIVWPVIVVPSMIALLFIFWKLLAGLSELSGLSTDEILKAEKK